MAPLPLPPPPPLLLPFLLLLFASPTLSSVTVTHLPGFSGALPFHLETGYVSVDGVNGVELFYYFLQSERDPKEDPLILWLTGGPGCSAFSGLVFEIGPLKFVTKRYDGSLPTLVYNHYSWTKVANIIFLDSPVGSGFSFSRQPKGYVVSEMSSSVQAYEFLRKWLVEHPQYLHNHLYIAGDSHGGKIVPVVTYKIAKGIEAGDSPLLNLKGYLVGNPLTGELVDQTSQVPYAHGEGIISDELFEEIQANCNGEDYVNLDPLKMACRLALDKFHMLTSEFSPAYIFDPECPLVSPRRKHMFGDRSLEEKYSEIMLPPVVPDFKCRSYTYYLSYYWANDYKTREALHIKKGTVQEWVRCNFSMAYTYDVPSTVVYHLNLTTKGYRALVYNGDKDLLITFIGTQAWIRSLNYSIVDDWRSWHVDGQVAGYTRKYSNNLTFATVKDAGHTAPEYQPKSCFMMFDRWVSHKPL
ncbi:serine carboxypeptidase-like 18 isoform X2 [Asparagus officinalis]|uniref:serine carboxypeptidase-like 18 isoform X2 n=1 Tax=Asparagus officinalis TaxID=4686 RepID=UPI00098E5C23|nr:serine carboxypeptidase-like 18 isoform X2 [Asparagus officinalis]